MAQTWKNLSNWNELDVKWNSTHWRGGVNTIAASYAYGTRVTAIVPWKLQRERMFDSVSQG